MTPKEALHEISTKVFRNTDDFEMRISKDCYKEIVNALEKQIPKFVLCPKGWRGMRDTRYYCPACNFLTRQHEKICHKCGQAVKYPREVYVKVENRIVLDWSDTE